MPKWEDGGKASWHLPYLSWVSDHTQAKSAPAGWVDLALSSPSAPRCRKVPLTAWHSTHATHHRLPLTASSCLCSPCHAICKNFQAEVLSTFPLPLTHHLVSPTGFAPQWDKWDYPASSPSLPPLIWISKIWSRTTHRSPPKTSGFPAGSLFPNPQASAVALLSPGKRREARGRDWSHPWSPSPSGPPPEQLGHNWGVSRFPNCLQRWGGDPVRDHSFQPFTVIAATSWREQRNCLYHLLLHGHKCELWTNTARSELDLQVKFVNMKNFLLFNIICLVLFTEPSN